MDIIHPPWQRQRQTQFPFHILVPQYHRYTIPHNYVHWEQTQDSHIFSANLPGFRKEEIKVEIEDSRYLIIRTEGVDGHGGSEPATAKRFWRKFRIPGLVDMDAISARLEDGVLKITAPRALRIGFYIRPGDVPLPQQLQLIARAA